MAKALDRGTARLGVTATTHVIGAGLAGLSAACELVARGERVAIYESGPAAGGRCRSYFDRGLGCRVDNGNHLLLSGNTAAMTYLERIGARGTLSGPASPRFPFVDLVSGESWTLAPSAGRLPWWVLSPGRRVPGTRAWQYLKLLALSRAGREATVAGVLGGAATLYRRLLEPLAVAALNTRPDAALASLLDAVTRETLMRGGRFCVPCVPREGLSESFVDPALAWLLGRGAVVGLARRVVALDIQDGRVAALHLLDGGVPLGARDRVVLAVPAWVARELLPGLVVPDQHESILNVHFRTAAAPLPHWRAERFIGLVGGTAEWVFAKPGVVAVTISAANHLVELAGDEIAARVWPEVERVLVPSAGALATLHMPPVRVVKERRATFAATAAQERRRPGARTALHNLVLAGDWTATGLPATIEGAIRSGRTAADSLRDAA